MDRAPSNTPLLVFDGDCSFCRIWIGFWKQLTGGQIEYAPYQEAAERFPEVPHENFTRAVQLILPNGEVLSAGHAVLRLLAHVPGYAWILWTYRNVPGVAAVTEWLYRLIAAHRSFFYRATVLLWGRQVAPASYEIATLWFLRCLGVIYLIAFVSLGVQITGLVGARGILPAAAFLNAVSQNYGGAPWWRLPTLFWLNASDTMLKLVCLAGAITAVAIVLGFARRAALAITFILYLSLVHIGQTFLSYQWDYLLLETGFLAIFLIPTFPRIWLFRWLLFRLMFLSGTAKLLSGDPTWRNLTALQYHYATQPLPTRFAWYFYQCPPDFQKVSAVFMFFVELIVPFLFFAPRRIRFFAAGITVLLEILIFITGNYTFFNLLAVALCLLLLDDAALRRFVRPRATTWRVTRFQRAGTAGLAAFVMLVSGFQLVEIFAGTMPQPAANALSWIAPFGVINTYGLFAVMTTSRSEIIVEGSNDGQTWLAYDFKYKPGNLKRLPGWVQPHQPRLDWQMWFAALGSYQGNRWFVNFMLRLLEGSPDVLALMVRNPFPSAPPRYIRAQVYDYSFTSFAERSATGAWWRRELKGEYFPVVSLKQR
ncbi:MAG TPA: lipase maturation factor family protein [Bryobacteraceae bacterium]|nr:lipase maturation factor family protein [Bryobacteraceae bacterium]